MYRRGREEDDKRLQVALLRKHGAGAPLLCVAWRANA